MINAVMTNLPTRFSDWFATRAWHAHDHQLAMLDAAKAGEDALLIAPTGGGKTLAGILPSLVDIAQNEPAGLHTLYISPLKALAVDIERNLKSPITEMDLPITVEPRTGDTPQTERRAQAKHPGDILVTTPESLYFSSGPRPARISPPCALSSSRKSTRWHPRSAALTSRCHWSGLPRLRR